MAPKKIIILLKPIILIYISNRNIRYTPAVTSVDECTREDTGVGAAIAIGSHALKGIWALFVKEAKIMKSTPPTLKLFN